MMSSLTAEQKKKIEENRQKALQRRAERGHVSQKTAASPINTGHTTRVTIPASSVTVPPKTDVSTSQPFVGVSQTWKPAAKSFGRGARFNRGKITQNTYPSHSKSNFYGQSQPPSVTGTCNLISAERFSVDFNGFNQSLIDCFKQQPGRMYHPEEKKWSFPISSHEQLVTALKELKPAVAVAPLPAKVLRVLRQPAPSSENVNLAALDPVLLDALMPFQREGIKTGVARGGRLLLADDMGLGKTIQAIGIMSYFHDWPLLVVCPSSMRYQWRQELRRFLPSQHPSTVAVMDSSKDFVDDARILIVSYDLVTRCSEQLRGVGFLSVIMDESHCLKSPKAARTRAAIPLMKAARRCLLLSGTPALSRPVELFTQLSAVDRSFAPSYQEFGIRYCAGHRTAWGWDFNGSSQMAELQVLLERRVMLRRLKRDVIGQLPAKRRQLVVLDASQVSAKSDKMSKLEERMSLKQLKGMERRGELLKYFRETAAAKLPAVLSYLETLLEAGHKFICFAHHQRVINGVCELLQSRKEGFIRIDGATSPESRQQQCERFQTAGDQVRVAVLSITAANTGITLTAASLVVFAELFWNPGVLTQAEDRAHRIGQRDSVQVSYLVARGTADDHIWPLVQKKLDVLNKAGLSKDNFKDADDCSQEKKQDQSSITDFISEFEDLPPEALEEWEDAETEAAAETETEAAAETETEAAAETETEAAEPPAKRPKAA